MTPEARSQALGTFASRGFTLELADDHLLELRHEGETVGFFSQTGATEQTIQAECARHLVVKHGWDGRLREKGSKNEVADESATSS